MLSSDNNQKIATYLQSQYVIYPYLGLSFDEFKNLLEPYFNQNISLKARDYPILIREVIRDYLNQIVQNDQDFAYLIDELALVLNNETNLALVKSQITEFLALLPNLDRSISSSFYEDFACNKIAPALNRLVNKYMKDLKNQKFAQSYPSLYSLIEIYCLNNNIELECSDEINVSDKTNTDNYNFGDEVNNYLKTIGAIPLLDADQQRKLAIAMHNGDQEARQLLIETNLRLVVYVAKNYRNRGFEFIDLIMEGNTGLIEGLEHYDPSRKAKVSSYVTWWIRKSIVDFLYRRSPRVRLPYIVYTGIARYRGMVNDSALNNHSLTDKEVMEKLHVSEDHLKMIKFYEQGVGSLNARVSEDDEGEFIDFVAGDELTDAEVMHKMMIKDMHRAFAKANLSERDIHILYMHLVKDLRLEDIGDVYHISRERVRQVEAEAIIKLRNVCFNQQLYEYLDNPARAKRLTEEFNANYTSKKRYKPYIGDFKN